jgi:hypothetical protein
MLPHGIASCSSSIGLSMLLCMLHTSKQIQANYRVDHHRCSWADTLYVLLHYMAIKASRCAGEQGPSPCNATGASLHAKHHVPNMHVACHTPAGARSANLLPFDTQVCSCSYPDTYPTSRPGWLPWYWHVRVHDRRTIAVHANAARHKPSAALRKNTPGQEVLHTWTLAPASAMQVNAYARSSGTQLRICSGHQGTIYPTHPTWCHPRSPSVGVCGQLSSGRGLLRDGHRATSWRRRYTLGGRLDQHHSIVIRQVTAEPS